jgi:hypothetical protein
MKQLPFFNTAIGELSDQRSLMEGTLDGEGWSGLALFTDWTAVYAVHDALFELRRA